MPEKKKVKLILEYDMGDYSDVEKEGGKISLDKWDWVESFMQSDAQVRDMEIVGVRIEEEE